MDKEIKQEVKLCNIAINEEIHKTLKIKCAELKVPMKEFVEQAILDRISFMLPQLDSMKEEDSE